MARQKPTNPDIPDWTLTPQQETAVDLLASGKTVTDTATAVEVTRQTVSEWLHHHPGFQAALNSRRQELWVGMTDTLQGLLPKAPEVLARELEGEHPLAAAVHVLKACGLYGLVTLLGPTKVEDAVLAEQERQSERRRRAVFAASFWTMTLEKRNAVGAHSAPNFLITLRHYITEACTIFW
jgi:hypothetical protein